MKTLKNENGAPHQPVLYKQIIHALSPITSGSYVDATVGAGGHSQGILESSSPDGQLLGFELDPEAASIALNRLNSFGSRFHLLQASYTSLLEGLHKQGWNKVDGIVCDLGVSSMQLDNADKGFSFQKEGPLDMRFSPENPVSASTLVNSWELNDLANIIFEFGEERYSRRIASAIISARPIQTTKQLSEIIEKAIGWKKGNPHPATRSFQAIRIAVNGELESLKTFLPQALKALVPGGRIAIISFHSLEDRIVKQYFRQESRDCICPPEQPVCTCGHKAQIMEITRHPIRPDEDEIRENPRSRSARLRVAEKLQPKKR